MFVVAADQRARAERELQVKMQRRLADAKDSAALPRPLHVPDTRDAGGK